MKTFKIIGGNPKLFRDNVLQRVCENEYVIEEPFEVCIADHRGEVTCFSKPGTTIKRTQVRSESLKIFAITEVEVPE